MHKGRLEAFSDGVLAIILTIMVLELRPPHGADLAALQPLAPKFLSYILSFVYLGIYWSNHHHMLQASQKVSGSILWANLHLLFWLSLVPFTTAWMGETGLHPVPVASYGVVLLMAAIAYTILTYCLVGTHGRDSHFARALGSDTKGKVSLALYAVAVGLSFIFPAVSCGIYVLVALIWLVPDRRFERSEQ